MDKYFFKFIEDVNPCLRGTHEIHDNWAPMNWHEYDAMVLYGLCTLKTSQIEQRNSNPKMSEKTIVTEVWIEMSNNIKIYYDHFLADIKIPNNIKNAFSQPTCI